MPRTRQQTLHDHFNSSSSPVSSRSQVTKSAAKRTRDRKSRSAVVTISSTDQDSSSDVDRIKFEVSHQVDTTEDDEVGPSSPVKTQATQRSNVVCSESERENKDSSPEDESASKGVGIRWLRLKKGSGSTNRQLAVRSDSSDTEIEQSIPRKRRKLVKGIRPSSDEDSLLDDSNGERMFSASQSFVLIILY